MADEISRIQLPNGNSYDVKDTVARQTLEHYKTPVTVTLAADGWSSTAPFSQTLKVAGITDSDNPIAKEVYDQSITLDAQKEIKKQTGYIDYGVTANGTITFICLTNKPSVNITLTLSFMSGGSTISGEDPGTVRVALDNEIERAKAAEKTNADAINGIDSQLDSMVTKNDLIDIIYPIGSIYMSVNDTDPSILFHGTWERIKDRFLLASGDTYSAGSTGGEAQHTLTEAEMPRHRHLPYIDGNMNDPKFRLFMGNDTWFNPDAGTSYFRVTGGFNSTEYKGFDANTNKVGGSQPHNNMPPYLSVYVWKRTA